jgi:hypothetical protein
MEPRISNIVVMSCRYGRFLKVTGLSDNMVAASIGSAAFFAPEQEIVPDSLLPPTILSFSILSQPQMEFL